MVSISHCAMQANQEGEKTLKVLMLESSPGWGGQEDRLLREAVWLQEKGHKVALACNDDATIIGRAGAAGVEARAVPFRTNVDFTGLMELSKLVRREKPDVIHARSSKDAWFASWFHMRGIPVIRSRHTTLPGKMRTGRRIAYRSGCRRLIAAAHFIARTMRDTLGVPDERIDVIGECVDTEEFSPGDGSLFRREFGIPNDAPLFGVVAMLREEKGHDTFLRAARKLLRSCSHARFVIVGSGRQDGPVEANIRRISSTEFGTSTSPGPVIMTGFRRDIPQVMRALDGLVVPSSQEAQTLVIPQAFATGKPVIGSRVGGIPEIVQEEHNGFLIEPGNAEQLAERMVHLAKDPELAHRLGQAGRSYAERELTVEVKMQQLLASYRKTIATPGQS
jgi:glycosyltransferase involved in cell wall biosynthesis